MPTLPQLDLNQKYREQESCPKQEIFKLTLSDTNGIYAPISLTVLEGRLAGTIKELACKFDITIG